MYFGAEWNTINTASMGTPLCGHHKEKPIPKAETEPGPRTPLPGWNPPPRDLTPQDLLRQLHLKRVAAHPDKPGGSHEAFLQANAKYEAFKRKLTSV
jgi:hypothetical protein